MGNHVVELFSRSDFDEVESKTTILLPGALFLIGKRSGKEDEVAEVWFDENQWTPARIKNWLVRSNKKPIDVRYAAGRKERILRKLLPYERLLEGKRPSFESPGDQYTIFSLFGFKLVLEKLFLPDPDIYLKTDRYNAYEYLLKGRYLKEIGIEGLEDVRLAANMEPKKIYKTHAQTPSRIALIDEEEKVVWRLRLLRKTRNVPIVFTENGRVHEDIFYRETRSNREAFVPDVSHTPVVICKEAMKSPN